MNTAKKIQCTILSVAFLVTSMTGCGSSTPKSTASKSESTSNEKLPPVKMEWLTGSPSAEVNDDAEIVKKIEERFNIDLKAWYVDSNKFYENLNVRFAGGDMPDVLGIDSTAKLSSYVDGGIVHELPIETIKEKAPNFTKVANENDDGSLWSTMIYKGKNYGVSNPVEATPMAMIWRKDWLNNLGLQVPKTLEEYENVLTAFVQNDPDKDGKKNTAGMAERAFGGVFGAFGLRCVTGARPGFTVEEMQLGKDNVPFIPYIQPNAKKALTVLNSWYKKGIIDKEFITGENHGGYQWLSHSLMNGKIGLTTAQPYHYLNASEDTQDKENWGVCMKELKGVNPNADIVMGPAPVGPDGESGTEAWNKVGVLTCLTEKAFNDPRKVDAFLAILDAYYTDMDYAKMVNFGIEGTHFKQTKNGPARIMEGADLRKDGVLQVAFGNTVVFAKNVASAKTKFGQSVCPNGYYRFNAPPVEEFSNVVTTLDTLTEKAYFDMITGVKPLDYFETYVTEFKKAGGDKAQKAVQDAYAAQQVK